MKLVCLFVFLFIFSLNAADWVTLQGTESKVSHIPWGFFQLRAQHNESQILEKDGFNKTPFAYVKPTLQNQSELQLARARAGIRGSLTDDNKINYFTLVELAPNGVNNPLGYQMHSYLTDASLTFKYLPVYVRVGRFKYAGSEEGNMARFVSPFIMFSTVGDQLMLERFIKTSRNDTVNEDLYIAVPSHGVGAYRDSGIQFFKDIEINEKSFITLSYMIGNGSGLANENLNNNNFTHYGFASYENLLGKGKGYRTESLKLYSWYQAGKRQLYSNGESHMYDRVRYGLGVTYFLNKLRIEAEYMKGEGMIMTGAKDVNAKQKEETWKYSMRASSDNVADGYYMLSTYELFNHLEVIARYDEYKRMKNSDLEYREFKTLTTGLSYIFKGYDRLDFNYALNEGNAPHNPAADSILKSMGNLISIQYTMVIK